MVSLLGALLTAGGILHPHSDCTFFRQPSRPALPSGNQRLKTCALGRTHEANVCKKVHLRARPPEPWAICRTLQPSMTQSGLLGSPLQTSAPPSPGNPRLPCPCPKLPEPRGCLPSLMLTTPQAGSFPQAPAQLLPGAVPPPAPQSPFRGA